MKFLSLFLFSIVFMISCAKEDHLRKIDSDITITIVEQLSESGSKLLIKSQTVEYWGCSNLKIAAWYNKTGENLTLNYLGIQNNLGYCATALGPARSEHSFKLNPGNYEMLPVNTYWAAISSSFSDYAFLQDRFIDGLADFNVNFRTYKDGDYGYFIITDGELPYYSTDNYWERTIIFEYAGNIDDFEELLSSLVHTYGYENVVISIKNFQGKRIDSWNL